MADKEVNQTGNTVGGDQVGRDKITNIVPRHSTQIQVLVEKWKSEAESDEDFKRIIRSLQHYIDEVVDEDIVGLEAKLEAAGRSDEIQKAARLKEYLWKHIQEYKLSKSAQEIFAFLLSKVDQRFDSYVTPLILDGRERREIDSAVSERVLEPTCDELEGTDFFMNMLDIRGMLYYLTGNCHIKWHCGDA